jgi:hypothetical protein
MINDFRGESPMNNPLGNSMADHHRRVGHAITLGVAASACSCGHVWTHDTSWLDKYRNELNPRD